MSPGFGVLGFLRGVGDGLLDLELLRGRNFDKKSGYKDGKLTYSLEDVPEIINVKFVFKADTIAVDLSKQY